jgi:hypothetical protein
MAKNETTYAEASRVLEAIKVLEGLERDGTISPAEQKALDRARASRKTAEQAQLETAATYGGFRSGATMNLYDEARGAYNAANELLRSGDVEAARAKYAEYRDLQRQIDEALQVAAPEQYAKGELSGSVASAVLPAGGVAKLTQGMGTVGRMATSAGTGAAVASLPEFGRGEGGFVPRVTNIPPSAPIIGGVAGAVAPVAGQIAGGVTRGVQDIIRGGQQGVSGAALRRMGRAVQRPQVAGQDIQQYLQSLGPEGMIADIPGSPRSVAQGLATMQGEGADVLGRRIEERAGGAGERVTETVTEAMGPEDAAYAARQAEAARKSSELGPMYDAALASENKFDVSALRSGIVMMADEAASNVKSSLNTVLRNLGQEGDISATKLHNARSALSDAITSAKMAGQSNKVRQLMPLLDDMDRRLDTIPDYSKARAGYAESSSIQRALDEGRNTFSGGPTSAMSPQDLSDMLNKMKPVEVDAYKKGAREYLAALMGTSRSDAASAWQQFDKAWNREKLELLLGKPDADAVIQRLFAEKEFSGTRSDVLKGSQTAFREEASESLADIREPDSGNRPGVISRGWRTLFDRPVNAMIDEVLYGSRRSNLNREIGELLTMQGAERDKIVPILLNEAKRLQDPTRAQQIVDALTTAGVMTYGATRGE